MDPVVNSVGEMLRRTREERSLSLDQASKVTRVRTSYLKALEDNEADLLPSVVQARGYLRLYADYLGLPVQPLLDAWPDGIPVIPRPQASVDVPETPVSEDSAEVMSEPDLTPTAAASVSEPAPSELPEETWLETMEPVSVRPIVTAGSQTIFNQIGDDLRQRRESISLSIQDIERYTRLREHYIRALEDGRVDDLPSFVQGRGMLANYAEFLDLDVDAFLTRFADALQSRRLELLASEKNLQKNGKVTSGESAKKTTVQKPGWRKFLTPDLMIGGTLFVLFIALVIWGAARVNSLRVDEIQPTPPSISEILMNPSASSPAATIESTPEPPPAAAPTLDESLPISPESTNMTATLPSIADAPLQVYVVASQRAWMKVTVDTSVVFQGRTIPGNAYPFTGRDRIELVTGDGSALQVVFNQQNLGGLGQVGEVIHLIFTKDGMVTPTAQFTPTFTVTTRPTNTVRPSPIPATPTVTPLIP